MQLSASSETVSSDRDSSSSSSSSSSLNASDQKIKQKPTVGNEKHKAKEFNVQEQKVEANNTSIKEIEQFKKQSH